MDLRMYFGSSGLDRPVNELSIRRIDPHCLAIGQAVHRCGRMRVPSVALSGLPCRQDHTCIIAFCDNFIDVRRRDVGSRCILCWRGCRNWFRTWHLLSPLFTEPYSSRSPFGHLDLPQKRCACLAVKKITTTRGPVVGPPRHVRVVPCVDSHVVSQRESGCLYFFSAACNAATAWVS